MKKPKLHKQSSLKRKQKLQEAAKALLSDYLTDEELISFTVLDREAFHE